MSFFAAMGNVWHTLPEGDTILINDITTFATISDTWRKDARVLIPYQVKDGELPHMISQKLYDTVEHWWTILNINNIYDFDNQWPRNYEQLNNYIDAKYPGQLRTTVHHYIDGNGLVADLLSLRIELGTSSDSLVIEQYGLEAISIEEYEIGVNERKREIILIDPDYIETVSSEYQKAMEV